jgi:hypothetical protein
VEENRDDSERLTGAAPASGLSSLRDQALLTRYQRFQKWSRAASHTTAAHWSTSARSVVDPTVVWATSARATVDPTAVAVCVPVLPPVHSTSAREGDRARLVETLCREVNDFFDRYPGLIRAQVEQSLGLAVGELGNCKLRRIRTVKLLKSRLAAIRACSERMATTAKEKLQVQPSGKGLMERGEGGGD